MKLTATEVKNAKPREKQYKLFDGGGLFLLIAPSGGKWWRFKYQFGGKEQLLSLGTYPEISLQQARERANDTRKQVALGVDPSENRKAVKATQSDSNTFEVVAREWFAKNAPTWAPKHSEKIIRRLESDIFPWLGKKAVKEISAKELLDVLRKIEDRGAVETAHRALQNCGQILRYAIATDRASHNVAADLKGALPPVKQKHLAAITDPKLIGELIRAIDAYQGTFVVKCALKLAPLVFVRPGELRTAEWSAFDLEKQEWRYTVTKTNTEHLVPLSRQAVEILEQIKPLTSRSRYVFPSARTITRPMSENAVLSALRRMGFAKDEMSGHGFRAMARTVLDEVLKQRPDYIEHQLAHAVKDPNGRAYNRTAHLDERRAMMQVWADYLDTLKGENVIPVNFGKTA